MSKKSNSHSSVSKPVSMSDSQWAYLRDKGFDVAARFREFVIEADLEQRAMSQFTEHMSDEEKQVVYEAFHFDLEYEGLR